MIVENVGLLQIKLLWTLVYSLSLTFFGINIELEIGSHDTCVFTHVRNC